MENIGVIFGGRSVEHEVSVITGMQIIENMDRSKYNPIPIYITKSGKFLSGDSLKILNHIKTKILMMQWKFSSNRFMVTKIYTV